MIAWLLTELEKSPTSFFREAALREKSPAQFENLKKRRLLEYARPDPDHETYPCTLPCSRTCPMEVVEMDWQRWAICPEDSEIDPIPLPEIKTSRYILSLPALIKALRADNGLTGVSYPITPRLHFMGERVVGEINTAFVLALFPNLRAAEAHILSLAARLPAQYSQTVVVTPSLNLSREPIYSRLRAASIFPVTLSATFGKRNFEFSYLAALKKRPPAGLPAPVPALTTSQIADREQYGYNCSDRLHIPGIFPMKKLNLVLVNGQEIRLGDKLFLLLLRLAVELKKGRGGWVHMSDLQAAGCINDPEHRQPISHLRTALKGSLREKNGLKFIESDRASQLRLSTHPDFVTYGKEKLKTHPDPNVIKLIT